MININLTGKRALVTGGNSGIGEAVVDALSDAGADVAVNYISHPDAAGAVVERVKAKGSRSVAIQADVSDETQVAGMFEKMDSALGGIDILVNNAGIDGKAGRAWELDTAHWKRVLDINLTGAFLMSHEALRRMVGQRSGVIINMTSVHEIIPWSGYAAYTASKAGLSMMTKTLAQEAESVSHPGRFALLRPRKPGQRSGPLIWFAQGGFFDSLRPELR